MRTSLNTWCISKWRGEKISHVLRSLVQHLAAGLLTLDAVVGEGYLYGMA